MIYKNNIQYVILLLIMKNVEYLPFVKKCGMKFCKKSGLNFLQYFFPIHFYLSFLCLCVLLDLLYLYSFSSLSCLCIFIQNCDPYRESFLSGFVFIVHSDVASDFLRFAEESKGPRQIEKMTNSPHSRQSLFYIESHRGYIIPIY